MRPRDPSPEILVVGAGTAGAAAAGMLAGAGRSVLLVDRREPEQAGAFWVNGVPVWIFDAVRLSLPAPPERVRSAGHAAVMADATGTHAVRVAGDPSVHFDMRRFTARLQARAVAAGAMLEQAEVVGVRVEAGRLSEVVLAHGAARETVRPLLTVDASGIAGAVRDRTPAFVSAPSPATPRTRCVACQYQYRVGSRAGAEAFMAEHGLNPGDGITFLSQAGGYSLIMVSVGVDLDEVGVLTGTVPEQGAPPPGVLQDSFLSGAPWVGPRLSGGQAEIPLGPPDVPLTAPGVALVGNAAGQVYAAHGSGVGMGLLAARVLADAVGAVPDPGDPKALWDYECRFQREYGGRLAASDLFRKFSQSLRADETAELITAGFFSESVIMPGLLQHPLMPPPRESLRLALRVIRRPGLLFRLLPVVSRVMLLQAVYRHFPGRPSARLRSAFRSVTQRIEAGVDG